jgi:hypothetical protein
MPALSAVRHDPIVEAFYESLKNAARKNAKPSAPSCANTLPASGLVSDSTSLPISACFFNQTHLQNI